MIFSSNQCLCHLHFWFFSKIFCSYLLNNLFCGMTIGRLWVVGRGWGRGIPQPLLSNVTGSCNPRPWPNILAQWTLSRGGEIIGLSSIEDKALKHPDTYSGSCTIRLSLFASSEEIQGMPAELALTKRFLAKVIVAASAGGGCCLMWCAISSRLWVCAWWVLCSFIHLLLVATQTQISTKSVHLGINWGH